MDNEVDFDEGTVEALLGIEMPIPRQTARRGVPLRPQEGPDRGDRGDGDVSGDVGFLTGYLVGLTHEEEQDVGNPVS